MTKKRYQVFLSSTFTDLVIERQKVIQAILELDCFPVGMELFPAADEDQWTLIKNLIDNCDYYVLIVGGRYGSTSFVGKSYTQMEYEYAMEKGIPIISFLHRDPMLIPQGKNEVNPEQQAQLKQFRDLAQKKMCQYWTTPDELKSEVMLSLYKLKENRPGIGWIRGDAPTQAYLDLRQEYSSLQGKTLGLREKNEILSEEIAELKKYDNRPVNVYDSFEDLWPDLKHVLSEEIYKAREERERLKIRCLGLCLHKSFPKIYEFFQKEQNNLSDVQIEMRFSTLDPSSSPWSVLNKVWTKHHETHEELMNEFKNFLTRLKPEKFSVKRYKYTHMPNWHGILINHKHLFLSSCMWDSYGNLTAGQNSYEYYIAGKSTRHDDKIKLFNRWFNYGRYNGSTGRDDALFFSSED